MAFFEKYKRILFSKTMLPWAIVGGVVSTAFTYMPKRNLFGSPNRYYHKLGPAIGVNAAVVLGLPAAFALILDEAQIRRLEE